jgi:hypothetical protein
LFIVPYIAARLLGRHWENLGPSAVMTYNQRRRQFAEQDYTI